MFDKIGVYEYLNKKGIKYECLEHAPVFTMEEMDAAGITARGIVCKNLFLRDQKGKTHFLVTVPEERKVDLSELAGKIYSSKLSFASPERLEKYLGVAQGSVSPLGVLNDKNHEVIVCLDKSLVHKEEIGIHPNDNTATVWLSFKDLKRLIEELGNEIIMI